MESCGEDNKGVIWYLPRFFCQKCQSSLDFFPDLTISLRLCSQRTWKTAPVQVMKLHWKISWLMAVSLKYYSAVFSLADCFPPLWALHLFTCSLLVWGRCQQYFGKVVTLTLAFCWNQSVKNYCTVGWKRDSEVEIIRAVRFLFFFFKSLRQLFSLGCSHHHCNNHSVQTHPRTKPTQTHF